MVCERMLVCMCGGGGVVCERDVSVHVWRRGVWCEM